MDSTVRDELNMFQKLTPVETVHENPWFIVKNRGGYFTTEYHNEQVVILPVIDNKAVLLVKAKRPVIADNSLELPAGGAHAGEEPLKAAARELLEETGIEISDLNRLIELPSIAGSPNRNPSLLHIYKVHISAEEYADRKPHDEEIESTALFTFNELRKRLIEGGIYVAVPMAVISTFLLSQDMDD